MSTYSKIQDRLLLSRIADSAIVNSGTSYSGDALDLPGSAHVATLITPVALFKCDVTGAPVGADFIIQVQSEEADDWRDVPGAVFSVTTASVAKRVEIGALGAATKIRVAGRNMSGLTTSDYYSLTVSIEGAIA